MATRRKPPTTAESDVEAQSWAEYIQSHLDGLGWSNATLATAAGIDRSLVGRWLNEGKLPSIESCRAVTRALHRDIREGLIAAGFFSADEMKLQATPKPDVRLLSDEELLKEIKRRMNRRGPFGPRYWEADGDGQIMDEDVSEVAEQTGEDVGETEEVRASPPSRRRARASG